MQVRYAKLAAYKEIAKADMQHFLLLPKTRLSRDSLAAHLTDNDACTIASRHDLLHVHICCMIIKKQQWSHLHIWVWRIPSQNSTTLVTVTVTRSKQVLWPSVAAYVRGVAV